MPLPSIEKGVIELSRLVKVGGIGATLGIVILLQALLAPAARGDGPVAGDPAAGKARYESSCAACHGRSGQGGFGPAITHPDDTAEEISQKVRAGGVGMPAFSAGQISDQDLANIIAYVQLRLQDAAPQALPQAQAEKGPVSMILEVPQNWTTGEPMLLTARLLDSQGQPVVGETVAFYFNVDFFVQDLMEIGEAVTDEEGVATLEYTPRTGSPVRVVAQYQGNGRYSAGQAEAGVEMEHGVPFYVPRAGLGMPSLAPWILALVVGAIWSTYLLVMYQVLCIARSKVKGGGS